MTKKTAAPALQRRIAPLVDELYKTRGKRYALQRAADQLEAREKQIRLELIAALPRFGATGAAGKVARAQLEGKTVARVDDWAKLRRYIVKADAWDLLQRRLADAAVQARWEAKQAVPGVSAERVTVVSLHKV